MTEIVQPREGYAVTQYHLIVGDKRTITFNPTAVTLVDAEITDDVYGVGKGLHTFRTLDPTFLDAVKDVMSDADPVLEFRLGFGTPSNTFWLPWQRHIVVKYHAKYEGIGQDAGHLLVFVTANSLIRLERSNKVLARKGTVSDIVKSIASDNKLDFVVEPTDGKFLIYQCFIDDTRFIRQRLLPRAITTKGRGGFYFFIRDNVLHFHTPDYQCTPRQLNYYNSFGTELTVNDLSQDPDIWDQGIAGIRVIAHDPYTAETREIESEPKNALRLADTIYQYANVNNGQRNMPYHLSFNPPVEVNAIAQFGYQQSRQQTFKCAFNLQKTISIRHGDLLNISITQQNASASSYSGYYYVACATHIIKKQSVTSAYTLERGELRGQTDSLTTQNAQQQLVADTKAPGQDPNILELQSSETTKGAGKQSSAKTYTVVADANKPLA